jgi:hypothetical protein
LLLVAAVALCAAHDGPHPEASEVQVCVSLVEAGRSPSVLLAPVTLSRLLVLISRALGSACVPVCACAPVCPCLRFVEDAVSHEGTPLTTLAACHLLIAASHHRSELLAGR